MPKTEPKGGVHRDLKVTDPLTEGRDIEALQRELNELSAQLDRIVRFTLDTDGKFGRRTLHAAIKGTFVLGLPEHVIEEMTKKRLVPQRVQLKLRQPETRDREERARAERRRKDLRQKLAKKPSLKRVRLSSSPGDPHWGGAGDVVAKFVEPFMVKRGLPIGSGKRTPAHNAAIGGSPNSDHLTTRTTTMARDFPTFTGEDDARALARAMGFGSWQPNSFNGFAFSAGGRSFRGQILWGASIGHADHVHVGVSSA